MNRHRLFLTSGLLFFCMSLLIPFSLCQAAFVDVTGLILDGNVLTVKAVMERVGSPIMAAGFRLTFPADRLQYLEVEDVAGAIIQARAAGCTLRVGYSATGPGSSRIVLPIRFRVTGQGPYMVAVNQGSLTDDLAGDSAGRPGWLKISGLETPALWSIPDSCGNLFLAVPRASRITDVALELDGQDILEGLIILSSFYYDQIQDVAYLILPGLDLPDGTYSLNGRVSYDDATSPLSVDVQVR
jgi:hypothetical protein